MQGPPEAIPTAYCWVRSAAPRFGYSASVHSALKLYDLSLKPAPRNRPTWQSAKATIQAVQATLNSSEADAVNADAVLSIGSGESPRVEMAAT